MLENSADLLQSSMSIFPPGRCRVYNRSSAAGSMGDTSAATTTEGMGRALVWRCRGGFKRVPVDEWLTFLSPLVRKVGVDSCVVGSWGQIAAGGMFQEGCSGEEQEGWIKPFQFRDFTVRLCGCG